MSLPASALLVASERRDLGDFLGERARFGGVVVADSLVSALEFVVSERWGS